MALYVAMHELTVERFPERIDAYLPFNLVLRSRQLRAGDYEALAALADLETKLRVRAHAVALRPLPGGARLEVEAELAGLRFGRDGDTVVWGAERADATAGLANSVVQLLLKHPGTHEEYRVPAEIELRLVDEPDGRGAGRAGRDGDDRIGDRGRRLPAPAGLVGGARGRGRRGLPRRRPRAPRPPERRT